MQRLVSYFKSKPGGKLGETEARAKALSKDYAKHAIRVGRSPEVLVGELDVYITKWTEVSETQRKANERSVLKPESTGAGHISSLAALGSLRSCCQKGCCTLYGPAAAT